MPGRRGPFYEHLADAIAINRERRPVYAAATGGRSRRLSSLLIWFERSSLPVAAWIDRQARPFNERGIGIVAGDIVPMIGIPDVATPPRWRRIATAGELRRVRDGLATLARGLRGALRTADFAAAAHLSMRCLRLIEATELETATHYAMSRHFVESIGLAATNALRYGEESGGETTALAKRLLWTQGLAMRFAVPFDRMAQPMHARGAGILVNDVPAIPFHAVYGGRFGSSGPPS